ncbi:MAG: hypothetical protein IKH28_02865 [Lachnospiraceae bacterium]|nr:hypothetical protein [Lachnospiraceae bacterium]
MIVTKTLDQKELTGGKVAYCICEINGCFGHINRDGLFEYVFLDELGRKILPSHTLYPSNFIFPSAGNEGQLIENNYYISAEYKDLKGDVE